MGRGQYIRANVMQTVDASIGFSTAFLRKLGRLKHGFPQVKTFTITWHNSQTKEVIASVECKVTPDQAIISFDLTSNGEKKPVILYIPFTWTACNYGGRRTWFLCQCGRRVGKIFLDGEQYGCRHCLRLTYQSRLGCQISRANGRLYSIAKQLKLDDPLHGWLAPLPPPRPKWMHRKRYRILCHHHKLWCLRKNLAVVKDFEQTYPGVLARLMKDRE
jgi:hypothetical protein